jgi:3-oxoadipate enol-lactonase
MEFTIMPEVEKCITTPDGRTLNVRWIAPSDDASPWLLFSNSLLTSQDIWSAQAEALQGAFGVLRYDQAGHGTSSVPDGPVDFDLLSEDLLAVLNAVGVEVCCGIGLSMGVPTLLAAYAKAPSRFSSLVLMDGQAKTAPGGYEAWRARIADAEENGILAFCETVAKRWMPECSDLGRISRLVDMMSATPLEGFRACAAALQRYDYLAVLDKVACPTQLIAGSLDGAMPESMKRDLGGGIANARFDLVEGAGHVPCFETPQDVNAILLRFLREVYL